MFSVSARYLDVTRHGPSSANQWLPRAHSLVQESLIECSDDVPSLSLLQALILTTFQELINGVRGRAWRAVGTCVRIGYELQLHLIDKNTARTQVAMSVDEERRRAWWTIWEFDVFACTICRLPTAIDWNQNETRLPIDDDIWFANGHEKSCTLDPDPAVAWKTLQASGNRSPKAWFIVINALMRSAHTISYPQSYTSGETPEDVRLHLEVLANSLFCLTTALPPEARYDGEFLTFSTCPDNRTSFQLDGAKHSIHIMTQLSRFMINHYQVFDSASRRLTSDSSATTQHITIDEAAWTHYLGAASEIVKLVRSCAPKHVSFVNPFLASTIWLAAAAQIVSRSFSSSPSERRVASSNFDVLQMNLNAFEEVWGVSKNLQQKLFALEARLNEFKEHASNESPRDATMSSNNLFTRGNIVLGPSQETQTQQQSQLLQTTAGSGSSNVWSTTPGYYWTDSANAGLGSNLWGWGVEELLQYGIT